MPNSSSATLRDSPVTAGGNVKIASSANPTLSATNTSDTSALGLGAGTVSTTSSRAKFETESRAELGNSTIVAGTNSVEVTASATSKAKPTVNSVAISTGATVNVVDSKVEVAGTTQAVVSGASNVSAGSLSVSAVDVNDVKPEVEASGAGLVDVTSSFLDAKVTRQTTAEIFSGSTLVMPTGSLALSATSTTLAESTNSSVGIGGVKVGVLTVNSTSEPRTIARLADNTYVNIADSLTIDAISANNAVATTDAVGFGLVSVDTNTPTGKVTSHVEAAALGDVVANSVSVLSSSNGDKTRAGAKAARGGYYSVGVSTVRAETKPTVITRGGGSITAANNVTFLAQSNSDADATSDSGSGGVVNVTSLDAAVELTPKVDVTIAEGMIIDAGGTLTLSAQHGAALPDFSDGTFNAATGVNVASDTVTFTKAHGLTSGDTVIYDSNSQTAIGGLSNGRRLNVLKTSDTSLAFGATVQSTLGTEPDLQTLVDVDRDEINFVGAHNLLSGDRVTYSPVAGSAVIGGLISGTTYEVVDFGGRTLKLIDPANRPAAAKSITGSAINGTTNTVSLASHGFANDQAVTYRAPTGKTFNNQLIDVKGDAAGNSKLDFEDNNNIYVESHGFSTGDEIVYTAASGVPIVELTSGTRYFVIKLNDNEIQLAATADEATGNNGATVTPIAISADPNESSTLLELRSISDLPIGGLTDGVTYYVKNATAGTFQLANAAGTILSLDPTDPVSGDVLTGTSTLGTEGIDITAVGSGGHSLRLDLTSAGTGTQKFDGIGGARALVSAPGGDGVATVSATGGGGGVIAVEAAETNATVSPDVGITIGSNGTPASKQVVLSASDISIGVDVKSSGSSTAYSTGGGVVAVGSATSRITMNSKGDIVIDNSQLTATDDLSVLSNNALNATVLADSDGAGGVQTAAAITSSTLNYQTTVQLGNGVSLTADDKVSVTSNTNVNADSHADGDARGFAGGSTAEAPIRIGTSAAPAVTKTELGQQTRVSGSDVDITASMNTFKTKSEADATGGAFGAGMRSNAEVTLHSTTDVLLKKDAAIVGDSVDLTAIVPAIDVYVDANSQCDCVGGTARATADGDYNNTTRITTQDDSKITAAALNVTASQTATQFQRKLNAHVGGIGQGDPKREGNFNAGREIDWNADVSFLSSAMADQPKLLIGADGTIVEAVGIKVNGKSTGSIATDTNATIDSISASNLPAGSATLTTSAVTGRIDSEAADDIPNGVIKGTQGSFSSPTAFTSVDIENQSNKPLIINNISVVSDSARPTITLNTQTNNLQFDVSSQVPANTTIDIRQTGSGGDISVNGTIDNPIGSTSLTNNVGNILTGSNGLARTGSLDVTATQGQIGTTTAAFNVELITSSWGTGLVNALAGQDVLLQLDGRHRNESADARFSSRTIVAGGLVDIELGDVLKQTTAAGTFTPGVDVKIGANAAQTYGTRYPTQQAGTETARDYRVFTDESASAKVDAAWDFTRIVGTDITVEATSRTATDNQLNISANTDVLRDVNPSGDLKFLSAGSISIQETGDAAIAEIASSAGNVSLTAIGAAASIFDVVAANDPTTAWLRGNSVTLIASGAIGSAADFLEIDSSTQATGSVTATGTNSIFLREVAGNLNVDAVASRSGDVVLVVVAGSLLEASTDDTVDIQGRHFEFTASDSIGTSSNPIEIHGAGIGLTDGVLQIVPNIPADGRLYALAGNDLFLKQMNGSLDILQAQATNGDLGLTVRETALTASSFTGAYGEDLLLRTDGGTSVLGQAVANPNIMAGGSVVLDAGDDLLIQTGTEVTAGTTAEFYADEYNQDTGVGATVSIAGDVKANSVTIATGIDIDFVEIISATGINAATVNVFGESNRLASPQPGFGDDRFFVQAIPASSSVTINGNSGADRYYISSTASKARFSETGYFDDDVNAIGRLGGTQERILGGLTINTNFAGNQGTRDAIFVSAADAPAGVTGQLASEQISGLSAGTIDFSTQEGASLLLQLSEHADNFRIKDLAGEFAVIANSGSGDDMLTVASDANRLNGVAGVIVFNGQAGTDALNVLGDAPQAAPGLFTAISITGMEMGTNSQYALQTRLGAVLDPESATNGTVPGGIFFGRRAGAENDYSSDVENVQITLGSGNDVVQIDSVDVFGTRTVSGGAGDDTLIVGSSANGLFPNSAGRVDFVDGTLVLNGDAGSDTIRIDDSGDSNANVGTVTGSTVTGLDMSGSVSFQTAEAIDILLGVQDDTFYVPSTSTGQPVTVNLGGGFDTAYVGTTSGNESAGTLSGIRADVAILGQGPEAGDRLFVNDHTSTGGQSYTVTNAVTGTLPVIGGDDLPLDTTTIARTGSANIRYERIETTVLNAGSGSDAIDIQRTHRELDPVGGKSAVFVVNAGGGNDVVSLGEPNSGNHSLDGFKIETDAPSGIPVFVNGQAGDDTIVYRDSATADDTTLTFLNQSFSEIFPSGTSQDYTELLGENPAAAGDFFSAVFGRNGSTDPINVRDIHIENLEVALGSGTDTFELMTGVYDRNITLNMGSGNDTATVVNSANLQGHTLTVNGEAGDDLLLANFSMPTLVSANALGETVLSVATVEVDNTFAEFDRGHYFVETREDAGTWQFRIVDSAGLAQETATVDGTNRTLAWQTIPAKSTYDTQRGIAVTFGQAADFVAATLSAGTAAEIQVGIPDVPMAIEFNGGAHGSEGDSLRFAGDGDVTGGQYRPDASQIGAGQLTVAAVDFRFSNVEPLIVHGLPDLDVTTPDDVAADLNIDSQRVNDLNVTDVTLHTLIIDGVVTWKQETKFVIDPLAETEEFGRSLDQDGNTLVVGAKLDDLDYGVVFVYTWDGTQWVEQAKLEPGDLSPGTGNGGDFGYSVAVSGDRILVGAPGDDTGGTNAGAVYVFRNAGGGWDQVDKITSDIATGHFGTSVDISGTRGVIGQPGPTTNSDSTAANFNTTQLEGVAFYSFSGNDSARDQFNPWYGDYGRSVSISGNHVVAGSPKIEETGVTYVYQQQGTGWAFQTTLRASDAESGERFGDAVAISGSQIVVGAPDWDNGSKTDQGRAFGFRGAGSNWDREARFTADGGLPANEASLEGFAGDHFGASVSTDGTYVVIGAPDADVSPATNAGAAYTFYRHADTGSGNGATWTRSSGDRGAGKLVAQNPAGADPVNAPLADHFGTSVSVVNGRVVAGIPGFNEVDSGNNILRADVGSIRTFNAGSLPALSNASMRAEILNGTGRFAENTLYEPNTGTLFVADTANQRVHVYINEGLYWRPTGTLQPPTNRVDFGKAMAVDDDRLIIGAPGSNRAYYYTRSGESWTLQRTLSGSTHFGTSVDIRGSRIVVGVPGHNLGYRTPGHSGGYMQLYTPGSAVVYNIDSQDNVLLNRRLFPDNGSLPLTGTLNSREWIQGAGTATAYEDIGKRGDSWAIQKGGWKILGNGLKDEASSFVLGPSTGLGIWDDGSEDTIFESDGFEAGAFLENLSGINNDTALVNTTANPNPRNNSDIRIRHFDGENVGRVLGDLGYLNDDIEEVELITLDLYGVGAGYRPKSETVGLPYSGVRTTYSGLQNGQWGSQVSFVGNSNTIAVGAPGKSRVSFYNLNVSTGSFYTNASGTPLRQSNGFVGQSGAGDSLIEVSGNRFIVREGNRISIRNSSGGLISSVDGGGSSFGTRDAIDGRGNVTLLNNPGTGTGRAYVYSTATPNNSSSFLALQGDAPVSQFGLGASIISQDFYVFGSASDKLFNFRRRGPAFSAVGSQLLPAPNAPAQLGSAVALSDTTAALGSVDFDNRGGVFVFNATASDTDRKPLATIQPDDLAAGDQFGTSVALFGDSASLTLVAGAPQQNNNDGAAYVYTGVADRWVREWKFSSSAAADRFGAAVAINGNTTVIGAPGGNAVHIYTRDGVVWSAATTLNGPDGFGSSVALQGNQLVVGAADSDLVRAFEFAGGSWSQVGSDLTGTSDSGFGSSVSISQGNIVVGAPDALTSGAAKAGAVHVYTRSGSSYNLAQTLDLGTSAAADDQLGISVAIDGSRIVAGAPGRDHSFNGDVRVDSGETFAWGLKSGTWRLETPIDPLFGSDAQAGDQAGFAVALSGDRAVIGAPQRDGRTNSANTDGAGYAFVRNVTEPTTVIYPDRQPVLLQGAEANIIHGTLGGTTTARLTFFDVDQVSLSTGAGDDKVTIGEQGLTAYALQSFSIDLDGGSDTVISLSDQIDPTAKGELVYTPTASSGSGKNFSTNPYRIADGEFEINGGSGDNELRAENDTDWALDGTQLTSRPGESLVARNFSSTRLVGGDSPNVITVENFSGDVAVDGGLGHDEFVVDDRPNSVTVTDTGANSNVFSLVGTSEADVFVITDDRVVFNGVTYQLVGVDTIRLSGAGGDDSFTVGELQTTTVYLDGQDGSDFYRANLGLNANTSLIRVTDTGPAPGTERDIIELDVGSTFGIPADDFLRATNNGADLRYDESIEEISLTGFAVNEGAPNQRLSLASLFGSYDPNRTYQASSANSDVTTVTRDGAFIELDFGDVGDAVITVNDGTTTERFNVSVLNVNPTVVIESIDGTATEGNAITVTANGTDPSGALTYEFVIRRNGVFHAGSGQQTAASYSFTAADDGDYSITVTATDSSGASALATDSLTIANANPTLIVDDVSAAVEGETITLTGSYADPGLLDTHVISVNWGDGTSDSNVVVTDGTFSLTHTYLDDNPLDAWDIRVTLGDDDGGTAESVTSITVSNVDPQLILDTFNPVVENDFATLSGTFSDVGILDSHTIDIDWGDGNIDQNVPVSGGLIDVQHQYLDNNASEQYTVVVTLRDDDGGTTTQSGTLPVLNFIPRTESDPVAAILEDGTAILTGTYEDAGTLDTHVLTVDWGDGTVDTDIPLSGGTYSLQHQYLDDNETDADEYRVILTITDKDAGQSVQETAIVVTNVAPVVILNSVPTIDENGIATLTGIINDPGTLDTFTLDVNWGDPLSPNNVETYSLPVSATGSQTFELTHQYLDDNPTASLSDQYTITLVTTDKDGGTVTETETVTVNNVTPVLQLNSVDAIVENGIAVLTGSISDPGTLDTFTLEVNWGDPRSPNNTETYTFPASNTGTQNFTLTHQYLDDDDDDEYTISVTLLDDDTAGDAGLVPVTVTNVDPNVDSLLATAPDGTLLNGVSIGGIDGAFNPDNLFGNSDFQNTPPLTKTGQNNQPYDVFADIVGWLATGRSGTIEVHEGDHGTGVATGNRVVELGRYQSISQTVTVEKSGRFEFSIDVAKRNSSSGKNGIRIFLDGEEFTRIHPTLNSLETYTFEFDLFAGDHTFEFKGLSWSTSEGSVIDNVRLAQTDTLDALNLDLCVHSDGDVELNGVFSDIGSIDTHQVTVDWGDGTSEVLSEFTDLDRDFVGNHAYTDGGVYEITVTLIDDDGGIAVETALVAIRGTGVVNGTLYVIGTDGNDYIDIKPTGSHLRVYERLSGSARRDIFIPNNDVHSILIGGCFGNDFISVRRDADVPVAVQAPGGNNVISALDGHELITTGAGTDRIRVGDGLFDINAGDGRNTIDGGIGDGTIVTGTGYETIRLGAGDHTIHVGDGGSYVSVGDGNNTMTASSGNDSIHMRDGDQIVDAGDGKNTIRAGDGHHLITTGSGKDNVSVGDGSFAIDVGAGANTVMTRDGDGWVTATDGSDSVRLGYGDHTIDVGDGGSYINVRHGNNTITAGSGTNRIVAQDGDLTVNAGDGKNTISARNGDHLVTTGSGNDVVTLGNGTFVVDLGEGKNQLRTGDGGGSVTTGSGYDSIRLGAGDHTINAGDGGTYISVLNGHNTITTGSGSDRIYTRDGDQIIDAGAGTNYVSARDGYHDITTGDGNDYITLGDGEFVVHAGDGRNDIRIDTGDGSVTTGDGYDSLVLNRGDHTIHIGAGSGSVNIIGDGNNHITATGGSNYIRTRNGNQTIITGDGRDSVYTGSGDDIIITGGDKDVINSGHGNDIVSAGEGNDTVWGGNGHDLLIGGEGRDKVKGGKGNDLMLANIVEFGADIPALESALNEWLTTANSTAAIGHLGVITEDNDKDLFYGESGIDELFGGLGDLLYS